MIEIHCGFLSASTMRVEDDIFLVCGSVGFQSLESFKDPLWTVVSGTDNLHLSPGSSLASHGISKLEICENNWSSHVVGARLRYDAARQTWSGSLLFPYYAPQTARHASYSQYLIHKASKERWRLIVQEFSASLQQVHEGT